MKVAISLCVALGWALLHPAGARGLTVETLALQNDPSPTGFPYRRFGNPVVGDTPSRVAVYGRTSGGARCIFKLDPTLAASVVVCRGDASPDGRAYLSFGEPPSINATSEVTWSSQLTFSRTGVYRGDGTQAPVALLGDPVPAPGTGLFHDFSFARIATSGDVVFIGSISSGAVILGVEVNEGVFRCSGGDGNCSSGTGVLSTVALIDDPIPDRPGRKLCDFTGLAASSYGVAFAASTKLDCAAGGEAPLGGVFRKPVAGPIVTVALQGEVSEPFPVPGGTIYGSLRNTLAISDVGHVAFVATTTGVTSTTVTTSTSTSTSSTSSTSTTSSTAVVTTTSTTSSSVTTSSATTTSTSSTTTTSVAPPLLSTTGIFLCDPATCPVAPATAAVTKGLLDDAGNAFSSFSTPGVSSAGDIAFSSRVGSPGFHGSGVYIRQIGGDIVTVALTGDPVPPPSPTAVFKKLTDPPAMSPSGKVAFRGRIKASVSPRNRRGIFLAE